MTESAQPSDLNVPELLQALAGFADLEQQTLHHKESRAFILYIRSLCDPAFVSGRLVAPFYELGGGEAYAKYLEGCPGRQEAANTQAALALLLRGYLLIQTEEGRFTLVDALKVQASPVGETSDENIVQGPSDSLTEALEVNLNLIRRRYQSAHLKLETVILGSLSQTKTAILYDESRVDQTVLAELKRRLDGIKVGKVEVLQAAGELERLLSEDPLRIFPLLVVSERPDRLVLGLSEGKIVILLDTTGYGILLPSTSNDFLTAMDDKYQMPVVGLFLRLLRYIGVAITLWLPALYVAFTSYNPEIVRIQIALLIAGSRATVPYPAFVEVLLMLLMMEFLVEASLRLPKAIGPAATTVGGLILGQAATAAGLVGNIMIILVSAVAISNFMIPLNMMSFTVRVLKYFFLALCAMFGVVGLVMGLVGMVMYMSHLRSFGKPYMRLYLIRNIRRTFKRARGG
ncbi:spore germination protein [Paenibacillus glufosinatiresistens]|uniref:spore germination protein n=1 Tax=Paenibacillus glufosinatiresistens TaxID=3070657 RepID=UPI00286E7885|nr:spore germination protein [Paenibacillus sp. YX.27]